MDGDAEEDDSGANEGVAGLCAEGEDEQEGGGGDEEDGDDGVAGGAEGEWWGGDACEWSFGAF